MKEGRKFPWENVNIVVRFCVEVWNNKEMGGGNGLKSHMSKQKHATAKAAESTKSTGGGKEGLKLRTETKIGISCAICKTPFQSIKMKSQLKDHWEGKHPRLAFTECFPGETLDATA